MFLFYHVTSRDHVFKGLYDLVGHFAKFSNHRPRGSSDAAAKIDFLMKGFGDFVKGNSLLYVLIVFMDI